MLMRLYYKLCTTNSVVALSTAGERVLSLHMHMQRGQRSKLSTLQWRRKEMSKENENARFEHVLIFNARVLQISGS